MLGSSLRVDAQQGLDETLNTRGAALMLAWMLHLI
jgi:hypothetical protein